MNILDVFTDQERKSLVAMADKSDVSDYVFLRGLVRREAEKNGFMDKSDPVRPPQLDIDDSQVECVAYLAINGGGGYSIAGNSDDTESDLIVVAQDIKDYMDAPTAIYRVVVRAPLPRLEELEGEVVDEVYS
jgi:hypothetical protein